MPTWFPMASPGSFSRVRAKRFRHNKPRSQSVPSTLLEAPDCPLSLSSVPFSPLWGFLSSECIECVG